MNIYQWELTACQRNRQMTSDGCKNDASIEGNQAEGINTTENKYNGLTEFEKYEVKFQRNRQ